MNRYYAVEWDKWRIYGEDNAEKEKETSDYKNKTYKRFEKRATKIIIIILYTHAHTHI